MSTLEIDVADLRARSVEFTATELVVTLAEGRKILTPARLVSSSRRRQRGPRGNYEIMPMGIHWPDVDEDLSIAAMLKGQQARSP